MRRRERCKAINNDEGGREETSTKAHDTEVDGPSAERSETTPARPPKARTEPKSMEKCNHGDRPGQGYDRQR